ncbi:MAG: amidohydrolase family protein [Spirochaetaceae bacterium]|nr:amidohydrolase family protein [Spirochaetaceae bacterium]
MNSFIIKGTFVHTLTKEKFEIKKDSYLVVIDNKVINIFDEKPKQYSQLELIDYTGKLIIPGLIDLHVHASQYRFRSSGMSLELLDWLNTYTFPEESKFEDEKYAKKIYSTFVNELKYGATTRACIFGTLHANATLILMDELENSGLISYVGKVNMDRNSPEYLVETTEESIAATKFWLDEIKLKNYKRSKPILTPRFIPSCSDDLMRGLKEIQKSYNVPFQSHLSENEKEIEWVKELCPNSKNYGDAYNQFGLFGGSCKTIMAHCVSSTDEEIDLMKANGVFVAHCPESNINLSSGIAPVRKFLNKGLKVGLATDMAAGSSPNMIKSIAYAIQVSKLYWRLVDNTCPALSISEAFYLATKGSGEFFNNVGSFEKGYEFDALVIDDSDIAFSTEFSIEDRVEKFIYLGSSKHIVSKYICGTKIF